MPVVEDYSESNTAMPTKPQQNSTEATTLAESASTLTIPTVVGTDTEKTQESPSTYEKTALPPDRTQESISLYSPPVPEDWESWPVLPEISPRMVEIYQEGIRQGRNAYAFSVFGDCQSLPDVYMGIYEDDPMEAANQPGLLRTIEHFQGSFSRESVTVKNGTTVAAILWEGWIDDDRSGCLFGETPLECEIRQHNPSIVFINLGTHWEVRNEMYLRKIVEELLTLGIVPIISTKADSREGDAVINEQLVKVAYEYQVPVLNFWAAVQDVENQGMLPNDDTYLSEQGIMIHRLTSLQALDSVWRTLNPEQ
jgi:hypothetical protein